jgi:predicted MFS family arabinose efflux permease
LALWCGFAGFFAVVAVVGVVIVAAVVLLVDDDEEAPQPAARSASEIAAAHKIGSCLNLILAKPRRPPSESLPQSPAS